MDALHDEVESLEAILMDDVTIKRNAESGAPEAIETTVFPVVGEDHEQQYVCVTLQVLPLAGYPDVSPEFKLSRPRGLDDARLEDIRAACIAKLHESIGFPVVFDLIEVVREHLTGSNLPSGQCVICLYGFADGDEFTRTNCFHYLHSYCLARHLNAMRRNYNEEFEKLPAWLKKTADPFQATCPVCRENIEDEAESLKCAMPPSELQNAPDFELTQALRELQQRMSDLFLQQKSRGAIIDTEAESGTVISIETEEEIRRRLQRKKDESHNTTEEANLLASASGDVPNDIPPGVKSMNFDSKPSTKASGSAYTTVVTEPTNNNYNHHNRRHYHRGGRRHQYHYYHHRDRDRERERHEYYHSSSHHSADAAATSANANGAPTTGNSKQQKSHASGAANSR